MSNEHRARDDEDPAQILVPREFLAEKHRGKQDDENHAEFIHRRDPRSLAELQGSEIAKPRQPGGQPRKHEEQPGTRSQRGQPTALARQPDQHHAEAEDHRRTHHGGKVGADPGHPHLRQHGSDGGKQRGTQRPPSPIGLHPFFYTIVARLQFQGHLDRGSLMLSPTTSTPPNRLDWRLLLTPAVIVGALGYFVDIYDLLLFSIVRTPSLKSLGFTGDALATQGLMLLNLQMAGMLLGGILWGIIGDKKGRLWLLLFGSIALYSAATFMANGLVHTVQRVRVLAGAGRGRVWRANSAEAWRSFRSCCRGRCRGYGTMIVATVGVFGAVVASLVAEVLNWRTAYLVGGACWGSACWRCASAWRNPGMFRAYGYVQAGVRRWEFSGSFHQPRTAGPLRELHPHRHAAVVRRRHPGDAVPGVCEGARRERDGDGGARHPVDVPGADVRGFSHGNAQSALALTQRRCCGLSFVAVAGGGGGVFPRAGG